MTSRSRLTFCGTSSQIACCVCEMTSFSSDGVTEYGDHVDLAAGQRQHASGRILDNPILDPVEIRPPRFSVFGIADHPDDFVRLELDEFERAEDCRLSVS